MKHYRIILATLLTVFLIGWLAACQTTSHVSDQPVTDDSLASQVKDRITRNGMITTYSLEVHASGGHVTLDGAVDTYRQKTTAGNIAQSVDGVETVDNRLDVVQQHESSILP